MNRKIYIPACLTALLTLALSGCNSWLDAKPEDRVTDKQLFSTVQGFRTALNGVYVAMNDRSLYGGDLLVTGVEVLAQRYDFSGNTNNISRLGTYDYTTDYSKALFAGIWEKAYALIANCNKLLEYAELNTDVMTGTDRALVMGEAHALRAFLHFDLLRLFGPIYKEDPTAVAIPYNTRYSISASSLLTAEQVIGKVLEDLEAAEELLEAADPIIQYGPQNHSSEDGLNHHNYRTQRLNYYAVKALQARVNLYAGNKAEAVKAAWTVIGVQERWFPFTKFGDVMGGTRSADRIFSSELLFSLYNTKRNDIYTDYFSPELNPAVAYLPKGNLDRFFIQEPDKDWRYSSTWLISSRQTYKCFHKYEDVTTTNTDLNRLIPLLRITEMYYIIAEASSDGAEALAAMNTVLNNRGLTELPNGDNLAATVREEYKREFWGEGQLFFYYKRVGEPSIHSFSEGKAIAMDAAKYVVPLPLSETDFRE